MVPRGMSLLNAAGRAPSGAAAAPEGPNGAELLRVRMERHRKRPGGSGTHAPDLHGLVGLDQPDRLNRLEPSERAPKTARTVWTASRARAEPDASFVQPGTACVMIGAPLGRPPAAELKRLGAHLRGLERLVEREYPLVEPDRELTSADFRYLRSLPATLEGVTCKRAALLLGLFAESGVGLRLAAADAAEGAGLGPRAGFVEDMDTRVLPVTVQHYVNGLFQDPDHFVLLSTVLHCMWGGEDLRLFDFQGSAGTAGPSAP